MTPGIRVRIVVPLRADDSEQTEVDAYYTAAAGLVAHADPLRDGEWRVTHLRSGLCFPFYFPDPESSQAAATAVAHFDWTVPASTIVADWPLNTIADLVRPHATSASNGPRHTALHDRNQAVLD